MQTPTEMQLPEIESAEIRKVLFPEIHEIQNRGQDGETPFFDTIKEAFEHFCSDNGYRITIPIGNEYEVTLRRPVKNPVVIMTWEAE